MPRRIAVFIPMLVVVILAQRLLPAPKASAQSTATPAELRIGGAVSAPLVLTAADLKKMPRKTLSVVNPHNQTKETYEGVLLEQLLHKPGYPKASNFEAALWPLM